MLFFFALNSSHQSFMVFSLLGFCFVFLFIFPYSCLNSMVQLFITLPRETLYNLFRLRVMVNVGSRLEQNRRLFEALVSLSRLILIFITTVGPPYLHGL